MGYIYAESLEHVAIGYDAGRQRFQLIIEGLRQTGQPLRVTHPVSLLAKAFRRAKKR